MKVLAFTDLHTDLKILKQLDTKVKEADLILCSGDIAWLGDGAKEMIKHFENWNKPMLLIHGNHESKEEIKSFTKKSENVEFIHKKVVIKEDMMIIGHGGEWYNQTSPDFEAWTIKLQEEITKKNPKKIILIVHMPVYNTKIDYIHSAHRGNKSYRKFIEKFQPNLVLMGHFHETFHFRDIIGKSLLLNPGPDGEFIEL